jgi:hypothetical protein
MYTGRPAFPLNVIMVSIRIAKLPVVVMGNGSAYLLELLRLPVHARTATRTSLTFREQEKSIRRAG